MKKAIRFSFSLLIIFTFASGLTYAQDISRLSKSKEISFKGESEKTEVIIKTSKDYNYLSISIEGRLYEGSATFEIIDPNGKVQGNFNIQTDDKVSKGEKTTVTTNVKGQLKKSFRNPIPGEWIIRTTPRNGSGMVQLHYEQVYHPQADVLEIDQIESSEISGIKRKEK
jgi:hypothetical protein